MVGWIGVDLDGTLANYNGWDGGRVGEPIPEMVERVKRAISNGKEVRILTARVAPEGRSDELQSRLQIAAQYRIISDWCQEHIGQALRITHRKDLGMLELWDDRAKQVIPNTGKFLEDEMRRTMEALRRTRALIRGEMIEHAVVFPEEPNLGLGEYLDRVLGEGL